MDGDRTTDGPNEVVFRDEAGVQNDTGRAFDHVRAAELLEKHVLIGLTYCNANGTPIRQEQIHGRIIRVDPDDVAIQLHDSLEAFHLPAVLSAFKSAPPGEYQLQSTGEIVVNPDLLTTWSLVAPLEDPRRYERRDVPRDGTG